MGIIRDHEVVIKDGETIEIQTANDDEHTVDLVLDATSDA